MKDPVLTKTTNIADLSQKEAALRFNALEAKLAEAPLAEALTKLGTYELLYRLSDPTLRRLPEINRRINDLIYKAWQQYREIPASIPFHNLYAAIGDTLRRRPERRFLGRIFDWHTAHLERLLQEYPLHRLQTLLNHSKDHSSLPTTNSRLLTPNSSFLTKENSSLQTIPNSSFLTPHSKLLLTLLYQEDLYPWLGAQTDTYRTHLRRLLLA